MEGSEIAAVRRFIKHTLNLSDACKISDFGLEMIAGQLSIKATITMGVSYQELSSLAESPAKRTYTPRCKPSIAPSRFNKPAGSYTASRSFEATASDFHCIRVILRGWRKSGKLTDNELDVIAGYADKTFKSQTPEEKATFLQFFYAVRSRLDQKKALSK